MKDYIHNGEVLPADLLGWPPTSVVLRAVADMVDGRLRRRSQRQGDESVLGSGDTDSASHPPAPTPGRSGLLRRVR